MFEDGAGQGGWRLSFNNSTLGISVMILKPELLLTFRQVEFDKIFECFYINIFAIVNQKPHELILSRTDGLSPLRAKQRVKQV